MGNTALHHASRCGHKDIVRFLIAYAPESIINMIDNEKGQTALHKAAAMKRRSISYMLVAAGSNLLLQDNAGKTPKILALEVDDHELAAYLESKSIKFLTFSFHNLMPKRLKADFGDLKRTFRKNLDAI